MQTYCLSTASKPACCFFLLLLAAVCRPVSAQPHVRARKIIEILCRKQWAGRGYDRKGDQKAARFLESRFSSLGLRRLPGRSSFTGEVSFSQNLFPATPKLRLGKRRLAAGADWLPAPDCPPLSGSFSIRRGGGKADSLFSLYHRPGSREAWVLGEKEPIPDRPGSDGVLWIRESVRLTHSLSTASSPRPVLLLRTGTLTPGDSVLTVEVRSEVRPVVSSNVMGWAPGRSDKGRFLVVCAHYDHLGSLGPRVFFPGANDNASGVALLLELADSVMRNPLPLPVLFIAFTGEEAGLIGSRSFVAAPPLPLDSIRFVLNLDLFGFGETGATVVNATLHPGEFERMVKINGMQGGLPALRSRGKAANSDHYPFSEKGVPAFFVYAMGGPGHYHDISDRPETLSLAGFDAFHRLFYSFLEGFSP
jgi:aminopeptidase YwaD